MKKTLLALAAALAAVGAQAATIVTVDNFDTGGLTIGPVAGSGNDGVRAISLTYTSGAQNNSNVSVNDFDPLQMSISNGPGRDTQIVATWTLASFTLPASFTNGGFFFDVVTSDDVDKNISFTLDGANLANVTLPGLATGPISLLVANSVLTTAAAGGTLVATINGNPGWDLTLDSIGFSFDEVIVPVPEPGSLALVGLALAGIAAARRRKV